MIANGLVRGALPALGQPKTPATIPHSHRRGKEFRRRSFRAGGRPAHAQIGRCSGGPWVTAGDRSFPLVLAWTWHGYIWSHMAFRCPIGNKDSCRAYGWVRKQVLTRGRSPLIWQPFPKDTASATQGQSQAIWQPLPQATVTVTLAHEGHVRQVAGHEQEPCRRVVGCDDLQCGQVHFGDDIPAGLGASRPRRPRFGSGHHVHRVQDFLVYDPCRICVVGVDGEPQQDSPVPGWPAPVFIGCHMDSMPMPPDVPRLT
jgi:hypothetical protein